MSVFSDIDADCFIGDSSQDSSPGVCCLNNLPIISISYARHMLGNLLSGVYMLELGIGLGR